MTVSLLLRTTWKKTGHLNAIKSACLSPATNMRSQLSSIRFHSTESPAPDQYDVVIVGGGIAGSALACALASGKASSTQRIALIEAFDLSNHINWSPRPDQYSNRVSSLTPKSVAFLKKIGVWSELDTSRVAACEGMQVWDGVSGARITFDSANVDSMQSSFLHHMFSGATAAVNDNVNYNGEQNSPSGDNSSPLAWMTENLHVQYGLQKQILAHQAKGIKLDIFEKTKVQGIHSNKIETPGSAGGVDISEWPIIQLDNGKRLQTRLLVGADGVNSPVRSFANIESLGWDYSQFGLVATLQVDPTTSTAPQNGKGIAWQRFLPTGPVAMLPLNNGLASLVWSTTPKIAQDLKKLPPRDFCALVNAAFISTPAELEYLYKNIGPDGQPLVDFQQEIEWRTNVQEAEVSRTFTRSDIEDIKPPKVVDVQENTRAPFPLRMRNSSSYVEDRVVLVGDAAHTVHPLAGQGLNQGLADVECLARVIEQSLLSGSDIGIERFLPNLAMLGTVDKLSKLYNTDFAPVVWARSLGLTAVDNMGPVKTEIMKFAMGLEDVASQAPLGGASGTAYARVGKYFHIQGGAVKEATQWGITGQHYALDLNTAWSTGTPVWKTLRAGHLARNPDGSKAFLTGISSMDNNTFYTFQSITNGIRVGIYSVPTDTWSYTNYTDIASDTTNGGFWPILDPKQNLIYALTGDMPSARSDFCMARSEDGNKIVLQGGRMQLNGSTPGIRPSGFSTEIFVLDVKSQKWTKGSSMTSSRIDSACVIVGDQFISWSGSMGDIGSDYIQQRIIGNEITIFNINSLQWVHNYIPPAYMSNSSTQTTDSPSQTISPQPSSSHGPNPGPNIGAIIGGVVVGVVVVIGIAGFLIFRRRKSNQSLEDNESKTEVTTDGGGGGYDPSNLRGPQESNTPGNPQGVISRLHPQDITNMSYHSPDTIG
ncbi:putative ubiquinone biosynthesis monooxygenase [Entomortierella beljakovae]|nr:putative ubiquinone biosynthesis monooxygenase [Entomortierella beljakovae]